MSISSISNTGSQELWQLLAASSQTTGTSQSSVQTVSSDSDTSVSLSDPGKIFSKLKQLSETDPEKFKTVMTDIADEIEKAAESSTDDNESGMLKSVAEKFKKAAESGDVSDAMPQGPPPSGPPPSGASESTTGGKVSAYSQAQNAGSDGFSALLNIINEVFEKDTSS